MFALTTCRSPVLDLFLLPQLKNLVVWIFPIHKDKYVFCAHHCSLAGSKAKPWVEYVTVSFPPSDPGVHLEELYREWVFVLLGSWSTRCWKLGCGTCSGEGYGCINCLLDWKSFSCVIPTTVWSEHWPCPLCPGSCLLFPILELAFPSYWLRLGDL